jgi:hypothetical protein
MLNARLLLTSGSVAVTVCTAVLFSGTDAVPLLVIVGAELDAA